MNILLLEDDTTLNESLTEYLELEGFNVDNAFSASEVYDKTYKNNYDLYIFDINLPQSSGFEVLQNLKEADDNTPTIYITALTDTNSVIKGFNIGAQDYIKKPFDPEELVIRIKSRFFNNKIIKYKDLTYNIETKELYKKDELIVLGEVGINILYLFLTNIGKVITTNELLEVLHEPSSNALRVNLAKLKKKLNIDFKNIRSQGYMLEKI
jgi:DNA-binding response OmpR family regulator